MKLGIRSAGAPARSFSPSAPSFSIFALALALQFAAGAYSAPADSSVQSQEPFAAYFKSETAAVQSRCLFDIHTLADWESKRDEYRRQLQEMLGLWPMPQKTELKPVITGKLEEEDFVVEKVYFEASPHLYVTADLYLPKHIEKPAPAILYVCGHSRVVTNGVSCGNKVGYQHHGAWFARNGYVCLTIDTLQLGEIEGMHHGTYSEGQWWWNSRGYTPAGVEAWFGIRALDYLCSRPEVDKERIGMTGRSGGGSYTWTVAALDERVKVAAPIAGMTDLRNQVVDGAVEGHCDCMFFVNTYRWDFPLVAALIAPRPLLIGNSDKDTIFPLDGVVRLHSQTRRIYQLYGAADHLGLLITEGPHADTQDLQVPVFRWFNRFLKNDQALVEMAAKPFFSAQDLKVFDQLPADQTNTKIQESFVPGGSLKPAGSLANAEVKAQTIALLRRKVFGGWPAEPVAPRIELVSRQTKDALLCETYKLTVQPGIDLDLFVILPKGKTRPHEVLLTVLDRRTRNDSPDNPDWSGWTPEHILQLHQKLKKENSAVAFFVPRAVTAESWANDSKKLTQVRRRYMLLGQTLDGMSVWDIRCAVQAIQSLAEFKSAEIFVKAEGEMGINAAYAALFQPAIRHLEISSVPQSHMQGPDYLNVLKIWDIPQLLQTLGERMHCN